MVRVLDEAGGDEALELGAPLGRDWRRVLFHYIQDDRLLVLFYVGWVTISQLVCEYARRPDINLSVVLLLPLNKFWRHPAHCAHTT